MELPVARLEGGGAEEESDPHDGEGDVNMSAENTNVVQRPSTEITTHWFLSSYTKVYSVMYDYGSVPE